MKRGGLLRGVKSTYSFRRYTWYDTKKKTTVPVLSFFLCILQIITNDNGHVKRDITVKFSTLN